MTALTSTEVSKLTAIVTGGGFRRAATRAEAINRFQKVCAEANIASPQVFLDKTYEQASIELSAAVSAARLIDTTQESAVEEIADSNVVSISSASRKAAVELAVASAPKKEPKANAPKEPTKREIMLDMVCSPEGATEDEICKRIGWKACLVTLKRAASAAGVTLRAEKQKGQKSRYFGTRPEGALA
ncbi:MAG: DUF3489 domain-containing protein [Brucella anthropi]